MSFVPFVVFAISTTALEAPVSEVTVYSDQARVIRSMRVSMSGPQAVEFPLLLDTVDASSIRVEAKNANVRRVDIARVQDDELPVDEARKLLNELEKLDAQLLKVSGELSALSAQREVLNRIRPATPPDEPLKPTARLNPSGWNMGVEFAAEQLKTVQAQIRDRQETQRQLIEKREVLAEKARLLGGARRRSGWKVTAHVTGQGAGELELSYRVWKARWYPTYDLALDPATSQVQVAFAGLVSQESGEDWTDARLILSTAVPATATVAPELSSWKIGEKERFIPTPRPMPERIAPAPRPVPPVAEVDEAALLRQRLLSRAAQPAPKSVAPAQLGMMGKRDSSKEYRGRTEYQFEDDVIDGDLVQPDGATRAPAPASPPPSERAQRRREVSKSHETLREEVAEGAADSGGEEEEISVTSDEAESPGFFGGLFKSGKKQSVSTLAFSLAPPPAYRPRRFDPKLPVSQAGGYDLTFTSLRTETIQSGKGARRVALFSESWPVQVERKVFPALAADAFLVAEIKSPSRQILPGGAAQLFVGADPAGTAQLKLVSPGEPFTLPLGLDRAIKPIRNVNLVQAEKGFIGKDEVNQYVVKIEIANPYATAIPVRIVDQWPVTSDKDVEVKLLETKPYAIQDKVKGSLEWRLTLPPSGKSEVSFTYTIRRPKGWRLHQH